MKIAISACLLGQKVTWRGDSNFNEAVKEIADQFDVLLVCPEVMGGLSIPRLPCEIVSDSPLCVQNIEGEDMTHAFQEGAFRCLEQMKKENVKIVILKANSPSCGNEKIYDGTFSHKFVDGQGVFVKMLRQEGIVVFNENQIKDMLTYLRKEDENGTYFKDETSI